MAIYSNDTDPNEAMWEKQNEPNPKYKVHYQKCYDFVSDIEYLGEENPGEHYFKITRREDENFWDPFDDECYALVTKNEMGVDIDFEGYSEYPCDEERQAMWTILKEKNII